ncbi:MAG: ABC1 kinase family protein [Lautropia sp.]
MLLETLGSARDLRRLNEIAVILVRHGFGDTVRRLGLADLLARAGHALRLDGAAELARLEPPVQVRKAMEELGPTFVKLGQILAGRADLFGPAWIAEFEKLQSRVPPVPIESLREQLRADLGGDPETVFAWFDPSPLAAASIAQVHRARLADGTEVVVKIRRPGVAERIEADLRLLERIASLAQTELPALKPYQPVRLVRAFARSLHRELDLAAECRNAERIAASLATAQPFIVIPRVHWAWTGERVNVQDFIDGIPGEAPQRLAAAGLDATLLARRGAQAMLKMIVEDGFFHADPHPGNIVYLPGNRVAFIDFGMVGRLSSDRRDEVLQLLLGLVERKPQGVAESLLEWAGHVRGIDVDELEMEIEAFVDQYRNTPLAQLSLGGMLEDATRLLREHHLALPADLALLVKAFITLESLGRGLDPGFHMATEALPALKSAAKARYQPAAIARRSRAGIARAMALAERLPDNVARLMRRAQRGQMRLELDLAHLRRVGDQIDRAASRLAIALVIAALVVGSSIVMTVSAGPRLFGLPLFGFLGFCGAALGGIWLVQSIRRNQRDDDTG